jgi:hypothetical protein
MNIFRFGNLRILKDASQNGQGFARKYGHHDPAILFA